MSPDGGEVRVRPVLGVPEIGDGDPLGKLIADAAGELADGDVLVISQKVVSKAEGRTRKLSSVIPSAEASKLARILGKEPNLVQLILEESAEVVRAERGVLIVETRHGLVCANAGIDSSNVGDTESVLLLPEDPDTSARRLRTEIGGSTGANAVPFEVAMAWMNPAIASSSIRNEARKATVAACPALAPNSLKP